MYSNSLEEVYITEEQAVNIREEVEEEEKLLSNI